MRKFVNYIKNLTLSDSKESSKRFIAVYTVLILMTYSVFMFTTPRNIVQVLGLLCGFVLTLCGVAVWQNIKNNQNGKDQ